MNVKKPKRMFVSKNKRIGQLLLLIVLMISFSIFSSALTLVVPSNQEIAENNTLTFNIHAENNSGTVNFSMTPQKGTLTSINDSYASYSWTPSFSDSGTYTIQFNATDTNSSSSAQTIITVSNTNQPISIISSTNPGTIETPITNINITTDKSADCKYDTQDNNYDSMKYSFVNVDSQKKIHTGTTPSLPQGDQTIYVQCMDEYQNQLITSFSINYTINLKPTAIITLNPHSPINSETVRVHVATSEDLIDAPELKYYFDDDTTLRSITLIGSGQNWEGYMIIKDSGNNRIGTFTFKGVDLTNIQGTKITSGKIFIVDTKKPPVIRSLEASNQDDRIKLVWTTNSNSEIDKYHIYRKVGTGGVDYNDYYKTTNDENIYDYDVEYNQAYYYKITAVDDAGNEGDLSKEVYVLHTPVISKDTTTDAPSSTDTSKTQPIKLNSKLEYQLSIKEKSIEKTLFDIAEIESKIGKAKGNDKITVIQSLGILSKIKEQKNKIINLQNDMKSLKNYDLSTEEFSQRSEEILQSVFSAWKETPQSVNIIDSSNYKEQINDQKTTDATNIFLQSRGVNLDADKLDLLIDQNKKLQDGLTVDVSVIKSKISYPQREDNFMTVEKIIKSNTPIDDAEIIDIIPKSFAATTTEVLFSDQPKVLQEDPVVVWDVNPLAKKTIIYSVKKDLDIVDAKTTKTIVITNKNLDTVISSGPTGMAIAGSVKSQSSYFIPIIVGILIIGILAAYYFLSTEERNVESVGSVGKKLFNFTSLFKARKEKIMPETYEEDNKLSFEDLSSGNKDFIHNKSDLGTANLTLNQIQQSNQESDLKITNQKIKDIQNIYDQLSSFSNYTSKQTELNLSDVQFIQQNTLKMRMLLDEIEKKNLETYTNNAKETLKYALMYMTKQDLKDKTSKDKTTNNSQTTLKDLSDNHDVEESTEKSQSSESQNTGLQDIESQSIYNIECDEDKAFVLSNGARIRSINALLNYVKFMDEDTFKYHVNDSKNDFSNWILNVFNNESLAAKIDKIKSKEELKKLIEK